MNVIHEYDAQGKHRIVVIDANDKRTEGRWVEHRSLAQHKGYYAASDFYKGILPEGVFRMNWVPHEVVRPGTTTDDWEAGRRKLLASALVLLSSHMNLKVLGDRPEIARVLWDEGMLTRYLDVNILRWLNNKKYHETLRIIEDELPDL